MKITLNLIKKQLTSENSKSICIDGETKKTLRSYGTYYKKAVKNGEVFLRESPKKYGGNPLPLEPGGDAYFPIGK